MFFSSLNHPARRALCHPPTWSEDFCLFLLVLLRLFLVALLGVVAFGHMVIK